MTSKVADKVLAACVQMEPRVGETARNIERTVELITEAAREGARIIVLPELASSGYVFTERGEVEEAAESIPGGPAVTAWEEVCRSEDVYVVTGLPEEADGVFYNSCVLVGPEGHVGTYRKVHLWNEENVYFKPGNAGFPVFDTPYGRLGMIICYDCWFPEAFRSCSLQGADIVCVPTNWVPIPGQAPAERAMANILCQANAHSNGVYVLAADRVGVEREQEFVGQSLIVDHTGWPLAGPASAESPEIIYAEVSAAEARAARTWNRYNDPLRNRRPEEYGTLTSAASDQGPTR
jgi:predicted amidohydrolase